MNLVRKNGQVASLVEELFEPFEPVLGEPRHGPGGDGGEGKRVKTAAACRVVPVHPEVVRLPGARRGPTGAGRPVRFSLTPPRGLLRRDWRNSDCLKVLKTITPAV